MYLLKEGQLNLLTSKRSLQETSLNYLHMQDYLMSIFQLVWKDYVSFTTNLIPNLQQKPR